MQHPGVKSLLTLRASAKNASEKVEMQRLSGRVLVSRLRDCRFEPHQCHCVVSLSKTHLSLLSTGTRKTHRDINEKLLTWR